MQSIERVLSENTGYNLFKEQGNKLKQKNYQKRARDWGKPLANPTSVKLPPFSIEGIVIEKKEGGYVNKKGNNSNKMGNYRKAFEARRVVNNTKYMVNGDVFLPDKVTNLVDNKMYLPRHKKLARDYGVNWLIKLSELAMTKGKPSRWYAKVTGTKNWKQTEEMLIKLFKKIDLMREKLSGIGVSNQWIMYFVGASQKLSEQVFIRCIELAKARGVKEPPNYLAKAIKNNLDILDPSTI